MLDDLMIRLGHDLAVYTGTHGILQYPDVDGEDQEIFLCPLLSSWITGMQKKSF